MSATLGRSMWYIQPQRMWAFVIMSPHLLIPGLQKHVRERAALGSLPTLCMCMDQVSEHLPSTKTKWSQAGGSSMRWSNMAHSRCKKRKNRCFSEEGCCYSRALAACHATELQASSSWQPSQPCSHYRDSSVPSQVCSWSPGGWVKWTCKLWSLGENSVCFPDTTGLKTLLYLPVMQLCLALPANLTVLPFGICRTWIFLFSSLSAKCASSEIYCKSTIQFEEHKEKEGN